MSDFGKSFLNHKLFRKAGGFLSYMRKKTKTYLGYTLEEKFTKETNSFESCKIRAGYIHNLSNLNEIMNISDFNEDQKLFYLSYYLNSASINFRVLFSHINEHFPQY